MKCSAVMFDAETGRQETYDFDAPDDIFHRPRMELIDMFFRYVDHVELPDDDVGYEIQSALKDHDKKVVTATGFLRLSNGQIPFMVMISPYFKH